MLIKKFISLLFFLFISLPTHAGLNADEILKLSDENRIPASSFSLYAEILSFKNNILDESSGLYLYSKKNNDEQFNSLLSFFEPKKDRGKLTLKNNNNIWVYDPNSKASIPISPQQRLVGQAANGDVVTVAWVNDYEATFVNNSVEVSDAYRKNKTAYHLKLTAKRPDVTYDMIHFWVEINTFMPIKAEFYTQSGQLLKIAYYRKIEDIFGKKIPTETVIVDALSPNWITLIKTKDYKKIDIPNYWFQREYLSKFKVNL